MPREILDEWPRLAWRHNGVGLLQAYLDDDTRVHVWHLKLLVPGMTNSGAMHDHRFDLHSTVLAGTLVNSMLEVEPDELGLFHVFDIGANSHEADAAMTRIGRVTVRLLSTDVLFEGDHYEVAAGAYHWARPTDELAITVAHIRNKDRERPVHILCPEDVVPIHAFRSPALRHVVDGLLDDARKLLEARAR